MAEYDLTPIDVDCGLQDTFDLLRKYFLRETNPFNVLTDFINPEDGFTIDLVRSYSFIASTFKATVHLAGYPQDDGHTLVKIHVKSVAEKENLEKEIRDRIAEALERMTAELKENPLPEKTEATPEQVRRNKIELIVIGIVAAVIIIGSLPISCSDQFSRLWIV